MVGYYCTANWAALPPSPAAVGEGLDENNNIDGESSATIVKNLPVHPSSFDQVSPQNLVDIGRMQRRLGQ